MTRNGTGLIRIPREIDIKRLIEYCERVYISEFFKIFSLFFSFFFLDIPEIYRKGNIRREQRSI